MMYTRRLPASLMCVWQVQDARGMYLSSGSRYLDLQVLDHYKDKVAHIVADKSAEDVAGQIASAMQ